MTRTESMQAISEIAKRCGLEVVGALGVEQWNEKSPTHLSRLRQWQSQGYAAEMAYLQRPAELFTTLEKFLPEVRSVISFLVPYRFPKSDPGPTPRGYGRVARYAWGRDYHSVLKTAVERFVAEYASTGREVLQYRIFTDSVPLLERAMASEASQGFVGKNTLLIRPGLGSFHFVAELLWDVDVQEHQPVTRQFNGCGSCQRCLDRCPTNAFPNPYVLDAGKCIAYLSIEKRTAFTTWEAQALGDWIFGCDVCQEVCPFNHRDPGVAALEEFSSKYGVGPFLELCEVFELESDEQFNTRFAHSAVRRAKRSGLIRNACAVAVNTHYYEALPLLEKRMRLDSSDLIRTAAADAIRALRGRVSSPL